MNAEAIQAALIGGVSKMPLGSKVWSRDRNVRHFWEKVEKTEACWLWKASRTHNGEGYGQFRWEQRSVDAHRVSWIIAHGEIPAGINVLHSCDNPVCVRPDHLFLGTDQDNVDDMLAKGRGRFPGMPKGTLAGSKNPASKLTAAMVAKIRERAQAGELRELIAASFSVSESQVNRIVQGRAWK